MTDAQVIQSFRLHVLAHAEAHGNVSETCRLFGVAAYGDLFEQAAALLHGIVTSHPLVDGNKRLGWLAMWVFLAKNDVVLDADEDDAYDLVIGIAAGEHREVADIAERLRDMPRSTS